MVDPSQRHQSSFSSGVNFISLIPYYAVVVFLIQALIGLVGANVQGINKPLTDTHAANLWSCVLATVVFCLAFAADTFFRHRRGADSSYFLGLVAIVAGSLSIVSLISMFLPCLIGNILLGLAWSLCIALIIVYKYGRLLKDEFDRLYQRNLKPFFSIILKCFEGDNNDNMAEQQVPQV